MGLRRDANRIIKRSIQATLPDAAVEKVLRGHMFSMGKIVVVSVGKAGWQMANTACSILKNRVHHGVVITKYAHSKGNLPHMDIYEAGHPVPDENSFVATQKAIEAVDDLTEQDTVLFLLSGGGSALFEKPLLPAAQVEDITQQLLACGASVVEINTIRKRISAVKGGRFAQICAPAQVFTVVLSDVLGDPLDMIASGPTYPDASICKQALAIAQKYQLRLSKQAWELLQQETPKALQNVEIQIAGNVQQLCAAAERTCRELQYEPILLTTELCCTARDAGSFLGAIAHTHWADGRRLAYIVGGETIVKLTGQGKGGRNQEIALASAPFLEGLPNVAVFSIGSDGTDGPTDAAGGYCDGLTMQCLRENQIDVEDVLAQNNAYYALQQCGGLVITGPTGTNVNDLSVVLIDNIGECRKKTRN